MFQMPSGQGRLASGLTYIPSEMIILCTVCKTCDHYVSIKALLFRRCLRLIAYTIISKSIIWFPERGLRDCEDSLCDYLPHLCDCSSSRPRFGAQSKNAEKLLMCDMAPVQGSAIRWALGCVNPTSWLPLAAPLPIQARPPYVRVVMTNAHLSN